MQTILANLIQHQDIFLKSKTLILQKWVYSESPKQILKLHNINPEVFITDYAGGVFDYFMGVVAQKLQIGDCPVMHSLLVFLKDRETSADEVFALCSNFRKAMIDFTYEVNIDSREIFEEIWFMFDTNFRGVLQFYTNSIFKKLVDAKQEAVLAGQAKDYFLSNMSHEIRTPLNAILGFVHLMLSEDITKKQNTYLDIIQNSGENLLSIINDILDFSKLRSGEFTVEPKFFSVHDEVTHTMELFVGSAINKDITITSFIDPMIPKELFGDALRIKQILSNFLSNAIKFTPNGGIIYVQASCENKILKLKVKDNGIGIDRKDLESIFSAFAQAQYTQTGSSVTGTGLGLSISQQLAQLMGGNVFVESSLGKGSCFSTNIPVDIHTNQCKIFDDISSMTQLKIGLYTKERAIPFQYESFLKYGNIFGMNMSLSDSLDAKFDIYILIHEEIDINIKTKMIDSSLKYIVLMSKDYDSYEPYENITSICFPLYCSKIYESFEQLLNKKSYDEKKENELIQFCGHILVAEDNEANQALIKIILSRYGLTYDLAFDGLEALRLYKENDYDLILMDEQMPIMNGVEAVSKIIHYENENNLRHTPISALTANVIKGAKERGLLNGFDSFLGKPIIITDLERVFLSYLKVTSNKERIKMKDTISTKDVIGLDMNKLKEELLLTHDEILMLVNLFINKIHRIVPEFEYVIKQRDYQKIRSISHSIKGSSANFRLQVLQDKADEMEIMAKEENTHYDYETKFKEIKEILLNIKIF